MNRQQKTEQIEGLRASLAGAPSVVVTRFDGLTVEKTEILRSEMRKAGVTYLVVKNTLMKKRLGARAVKAHELLENTGDVLTELQATTYRALAARVNYLSLDRPDISYASKELCRSYAQPT